MSDARLPVAGDRSLGPLGRLAALRARGAGDDLRWRVFGVLAVTVAAAVVFFWTAGFNAGRPDIFYLADAFLHGRTWLDHGLGPWDVIDRGGRYYVPFPPFPSIFFMPLMLIVSPATAHQYEPLINSTLAAIDVGLTWLLAARLGVRRPLDRLWLAILLGFSTQIWWVTVRGGVWHTGHLIATALTLLALMESFGRRRPLLIGLLLGAAFLTRPPIVLAGVFYAWLLTSGRSVRSADGRRAIAHDWSLLGLGLAPAVAFYFWYNAVRFGSPFESGYALAALPDWLAALRAQGLFSLSHWAMNWDYFMLKQPKPIPDYPFFKPDGLGMSILITSPALLVGLLADWRKAMSWALGLTFALVMIPNLLYYGGGWLQYGYRYALDAIPFAVALCGLAIARRGPGWYGWLLLAFGVVVNAFGAYWAYRI